MMVITTSRRRPARAVSVRLEDFATSDPQSTPNHLTKVEEPQTAVSPLLGFTRLMSPNKGGHSCVRKFA